MKILLTGHTSGLGLGIISILSGKHLIDGVSRSNGYDISIPESRYKIIRASLDYDCFINNAYCKDHQCDLLLEMHRSWQRKDKTGLIINIGSRAATDYNLRESPSMYDFHKVALHTLCTSLSQRTPNISISEICYGYIDTPRQKLIERDKLSVEDSVSYIDLILDKYPSNIIRHLLVNR